ncbi:hypothetical protein E4T56_gene10555 [Termitomyces sp. T112]|nr:hypothetical protein E4T56_gene10555 [Termitomyces sp. T112]
MQPAQAAQHQADKHPICSPSGQFSTQDMDQFLHHTHLEAYLSTDSISHDIAMDCSPGQSINLTISVKTRPLNPRTSPINPPNPQKTPDTPPNFRPCPAPILANSDASPANSNGPLANFGAFSAATDTYPGSPKPREPPLLFPIFATHHQLNTLVPLTYSGVSRQPRSNPRSPMIPSTYQRNPILDRNRHPPTPSSSTKPRRRSQRTPKFSDREASGIPGGSLGNRGGMGPPGETLELAKEVSEFARVGAGVGQRLGQVERALVGAVEMWGLLGKSVNRCPFEKQEWAK